MTGYHALAVASDMAVVDAFRRDRSESAARVLIDRFSARALRTVVRVLGPHGDVAEDVLQDAWIRAFGSIAQFRAESAFATWFTRIAIRAALDHLRKYEMRTPHLTLDDAPAVAAVERDVHLSTDLENALATLSANPRSVIVMHDIEGYTHEDIAEALGIAVGTSKAHLHHARRKLRALLDPSSHEEASA
ncbi:MAG TPA: RNA polymerase sigma factor [Gemmatimonadaceae bacterium]|nr:RNA polymerase sigma factor [Gemmatimonadaceae bacterium]